MKSRVLTEADFQNFMSKPLSLGQQNYFAFYSSLFDGMSTDPRWMWVPLDDHLVHRGDGIFEAAKVMNGKIYLLDPHLERLAKSADKLSLKLPHSLDEIKKILMDLVSLSGQKEGLVRLFISRGPGGFSTNPYECQGSQMYAVITHLAKVSEDKYVKGVRAGISKIPQKEPFWATVKSCNYLPNVLMKKEAVDQGLDFTISIDDKGLVAEGSTENVAFLNQDNEIIVPNFSRILRGTMLIRAMELARAHLTTEGLVWGATERDFTVADLKSAKEAWFLGTTLDVLPISEFDGRAIPVGPVGKKLRELLIRDQNS